ncbi:MAG: hypothetical protein AAF456_09130 [Planctomycetota bacterium]
MKASSNPPEGIWKSAWLLLLQQLTLLAQRLPSWTSRLVPSRRWLLPVKWAWSAGSGLMWWLLFPARKLFAATLNLVAPCTRWMIPGRQWLAPAVWCSGIAVAIFRALRFWFDPVERMCAPMTQLVVPRVRNFIDPYLDKVPPREKWLDPPSWAPLVPSLGTLLRLGILGLGLLMIVASLAKPWWDLPCPEDGIAYGPQDIVAVRIPCQIYFKAMLAIGLCVFLFLRWYQRTWSMACLFVGCSMMMVGATFPYFVMFGYPETAADAAWLQMQHDNLTWLGGDINTAAEAGLSAWKSKNIWVDIPRHIKIAPLPGWSLWDIQLDKLQDILIWTGYSQIFCQFARGGWGMGLTGSLLLTSMTLLHPKQLDLRRTGVAVVYLTIMSLIGISLALYGPFSAKHYLSEATAAMREGDFERSLEQLELCRAQYPVLSQETNYIRQRGLIEHKLGMSTDHALLWQATTDEAAGFVQRAYDNWKILCDSETQAVRRESLRAVQRLATEDYNVNRVAQSRERLEFVLQRQPANVKAIYFLQIIAIREKNVEEAFRLCDWMYAVTEHLNFATVKVLKSVSQQHALVAAAQSGDPDAIWERIRGTKNP